MIIWFFWHCMAYDLIQPHPSSSVLCIQHTCTSLLHLSQFFTECVGRRSFSYRLSCRFWQTSQHLTHAVDVFDSWTSLYNLSTPSNCRFPDSIVIANCTPYKCEINNLWTRKQMTTFRIGLEHNMDMLCESEVRKGSYGAVRENLGQWTWWATSNKTVPIFMWRGRDVHSLNKVKVSCPYPMKSVGGGLISLT